MRKLISVALVLCMMITTFGMLSIPASAAKAEWYDEWYMWGEKDTVTFADGEAIIRVGKGGGGADGLTGGFQLTEDALKGKIENGVFDVEWGLMIEETGCPYVNITVSAGNSRMMLSHYTTGRLYITGAFGVDFAVGNDYHKYRAIGNGETVNVYADGKLVMENVPLQKGGYGYGILCNGRNTADLDHVSYWDSVKVNKPGGAVDTEEEEEIDETNYSYSAGTPKEIVDEFHADFEDGTSEGFPMLDGKNWWVENGVFQVYKATDGVINLNYNSTSLPINLGYGRDFVLDARIRIPMFGNRVGLFVEYPGYKIPLDFRWNMIVFDKNATDNVRTSEELDWDDGQWHDLKIVTSEAGSYYTVFVDGRQVLDGPANPYTGNGHIYMFAVAYGGDNPCHMQVDSIDVVTTRYDMSVSLPYEGAEYLENGKIDFAAKLKRYANAEEFPSVDYVINGQVVATGKAPDYKATATNLTPGTYEVIAVSGGHKSLPVSFTVLPRMKGELLGELNASGKLSASLNLFDESTTRVSEVVYLLDGEVVGSSKTAPYSLNLSGIDLKAHSLVALCRDAGGIVLEKFTKKILPEVPETAASTNYANEISYTVTGNSGSATVDVSNGNHRLYLKHTKDALICLNDDGEESIEAGVGKYTILTDGPYAEIYHNGQMVTSAYMPMTNKVERKVSENGLKVTSYSASIPAERQNYFVKRNVKDKESIYTLNNLPFYHVTDFVAGKDDEVQIAINDEYYQADLTLKDGKFTVWTTANNTSAPYEMEIGTPDTNEDVYYRLEMVAGMCRLSANGRAIGVFRGVRCAGEPTLAVNVTRGELPYLAVSDYTDIYLYQDSFDGSGKISANDMWETTDMQAVVLEDMGKMLLVAGEDEGFATLSAFAGDAVLRADVTVSEAKGGVWLFGNNDMNSYHTKAGYNFETSQYEIYEYETNGGGSIITKKVTAAGDFPLNQNVEMEIRIDKKHDSKSVSLYVNGAHILTKENCLIHHGKMGFVLKNNSAYVNAVDYRGSAKPVAEVNQDWSGYTGVGLQQSQYFDKPGGGVIATGVSNYYATYDGGDNWEKVKTGTGEIGGQVTKLPTGEFVSLVKTTVSTNDAGIPFRNWESYISADDMKTWTYQGMVLTEPEMDGNMTEGRISAGAYTGRIHMPIAGASTEDFGITHFYYSDDKGKTWNYTETFDARELGYSVQEPKVIEYKDVTRLYFRNDKGFIMYYNSYDGGKTWDRENLVRLPMFTALNMFGVTQDVRDPNTVYIGWSQDNTNLHGTIQFPRTNYTIYKSTDAGDTWEFFGTIYESDNAYQAYNQMNVNCHATSDYLFMVAMCSDFHEQLCTGNRTTGVSIHKNVSTKRLTMPHWRVANQIPVIMSEAEEEACLVVNTKTGDVLLHSQRVEGLAADSAITVECAESYLGVEVEIPAEKLISKNGKQYVNLETVAELSGLYVAEQGDIKILSPYDGWSGGPKAKALAYTVAPFSGVK